MTKFRCATCDASAAQWVGRCPECAAWNSLVEDVPVAAPAGKPVSLQEASDDCSVPRPTGLCELDRVLGGGLVPGSVSVLGGEPGIGKSTLLLQMVGAVASKVLYVCGEESVGQVAARARRLGVVQPQVSLTSATSLPEILDHMATVDPAVAIIDSIQAVYDPEIGGVPGTARQVRECAQRLTTAAKHAGAAVILVGHVTKDGDLAGPRTLEHLVDTVLSFEGDRHTGLRLLRAVKHRFGSTGELGVFEMTGDGLHAVGDPSALFLADRRAEAPGSVVVPVVDGDRPLCVELQALVVPSSLGTPRRTVSGLDSRRLAMFLAIIEGCLRAKFANEDVYASVVGGLRVDDPAADLGAVLAIVSAQSGKPLPEGLIACGEVGLGGEIRQVGQLDRRLGEAARLGFKRVLVPAKAPAAVADIGIEPVATVAEAVHTAFT